MKKFRKKPIVIEAKQWFPWVKNDCVLTGDKRPLKYFDGQGRACIFLDNQGWIGTLEGGHVVSSGDWIITGINGEKYSCKPDIFAKTYERVGEDIKNEEII